MKAFLITIFTFICLATSAQSPRMARTFYQSGQYEKAIELYKILHQKHSYRTDYFKFLVSSYQQLEKYNAAQEIILKRLQKYPKQKQLNVELGYNYALQNQDKKANFYYDLALKSVEKDPNLGYNTGKLFQDNNLLDYALKTYQTAMRINSELNFNLQIALIYGEQGAINSMFDGFLKIVEKDKSYTLSILRYIGKFITDDAKNENNILFKTLLIQRLQNNPDTSWNILLSWLFMQEKRYNKAFIQEKALFKRKPGDLNRIIVLGKIAYNESVFNTSSQCFEFVLKNTQQITLKILANLYLLKTEIATKDTPKELQQINLKFQNLILKFGFNKETLNIQHEYASFLSYKLNRPNAAINLIKRPLKLNLDSYQKGALKLKLADIFVFSNQLNQALITYTQIKLNFKNSALAQQATFKIAQTSYYKGDFDWAQTQLKVLKSETSQRIANDALKLSLLIANNNQTDKPQSLKSYAAAELLALQNKEEMAIDTLSAVIQKFKKYPIKIYALNKQAQLFTKLKEFDKAEANYLKILKQDKESILADDACFSLAQLYQKKLFDPTKAAQFYEKIIFDYPASIYLVEARNKFRKLRPEPLN
ncbi:MAG: hypothetical protein L3J45_06970 [Flavobacteriaceae bacterium]|nr:hypothetical protein [Flavobacteriaceae bacterium]